MVKFHDCAAAVTAGSIENCVPSSKENMLAEAPIQLNTSNSNLLDLPEYQPSLVDHKDTEPFWGSFRQIGWVMPHQTAEGLVKKSVFISIPLPPGTEHLGDEMINKMRLHLTGQSNEERTETFNDERTLLATQYEIPKAAQITDLISLFYKITRDCILNCETINRESVQVQDYLALEGIRQSYIPQLAQQIETILNDPNPTRITAWESVNGTLLVSNRYLNGSLIGTDAKGNDFEIDERLAAGEFGHKKWLPRFKSMQAEANGDVESSTLTFIDDVDGTETVSRCGNSEGCSAIFRKVIHNVTSVASKIRNGTKEVVSKIKRNLRVQPSNAFALAGGGASSSETSSCQACGKDKFGEEENRCDCNKKDRSN